MNYLIQLEALGRLELLRWVVYTPAPFSTELEKRAQGLNLANLCRPADPMLGIKGVHLVDAEFPDGEDTISVRLYP